VNGQESTLKQAQALAQWNPEEFNSLRLLAIDFSQNQFQGIMDRLQALRGGQPRVSLSGVMINSEGKAVSLDQVAQSLHALGGGAGSDDAGGLLDNRLGFWVRGNYGTGRKDTTLADSGFKSDQLGMTGGVDYRIGSASVIGASLGFGKADLDFRSETDSGVKNDTYAVSVYGSAYLGGAYLDAVINYISAQYETNRHIVYTEFGNTIDRTARGATDGTTVSGGINLGYDFNFGAFTVAPTIGYYYADAKIDNFTEVGAMGLDLQFNEQKYKSSAANAAVRLSYAMKTSWGVLIPHFRGTYVHEMDKDAEVFGVRFANDPFASSTDPTPPIVIRSDALDQSYFRLAAGFSAQLKNDLSGYFEYQRLAGFQNVSFEDFTFGLRLQHSFR
jgi:outer membrane autotransporter protein